jgi:hypothetical protein
MRTFSLLLRHLRLSSFSSALVLYLLRSDAPVNPCDSKRRFNSSLSQSYTGLGGRKFVIGYASGSAVGFLGQDKTCLGSGQLCAQQQQFGQVICASSPLLPSRHGVLKDR